MIRIWTIEDLRHELCEIHLVDLNTVSGEVLESVHLCNPDEPTLINNADAYDRMDDSNNTPLNQADMDSVVIKQRHLTVAECEAWGI